MKRVLVLMLLVVGGGAVIAAKMEAQRGGAPAAVNLQLEKVKDGVYQVPINAGATTTIFVTDDNGVVLVDTKNPGSGQAILDKVQLITDKPVTTIINTHSHNDHVGGNLEFPANVEIIAHENTAKYMAGMNNFADAANRYGLPDRTFSDRMTVFDGNDAIDLYYFGRAHTGGDAFVVFRSKRVMAAGDVYPATGSPIIDLENGGSGLEWGDTIARAGAGIQNVDIVTRGHSSQTSDMAGFREYGEFMKAFAAAVRSAYAAGRTAEQAAAELQLAPRFHDYFIGLSGRADRTGPTVNSMYEELERGNAR